MIQIWPTTSNKARRQRVTHTREERGFTFPEVLAAMVFTAVVVPTALQGVAIAHRASVFSQRQAVAVRLAEQTLNEIIISQSWQSGLNEGAYGEDHPNVHWKLFSEHWQQDDMRVLTVAVYFPLQGQERHVRLSALVSDDELNEDE